jgi:hypothetical protein
MIHNIKVLNYFLLWYKTTTELREVRRVHEA